MNALSLHTNTELITGVESKSCQHSASWAFVCSFARYCCGAMAHLVCSKDLRLARATQDNGSVCNRRMKQTTWRLRLSTTMIRISWLWFHFFSLQLSQATFPDGTLLHAVFSGWNVNAILQNLESGSSDTWLPLLMFVLSVNYSV